MLLIGHPWPKLNRFGTLIKSLNPLFLMLKVRRQNGTVTHKQLFLRFLKHCWQNNLTSADIFKLAAVADIKELREIFAGTPLAQPFAEEGNERMFGSVRAIVGRYISPFQYLEADAGVDNGFSLKEIVSSENAKGWLFFNFRDDQLETIKPIIAAMADIISKTICQWKNPKLGNFG